PARNGATRAGRHQAPGKSLRLCHRDISRAPSTASGLHHRLLTASRTRSAELPTRPTASRTCSSVHPSSRAVWRRLAATKVQGVKRSELSPLRRLVDDQRKTRLPWLPVQLVDN